MLPRNGSESISTQQYPHFRSSLLQRAGAWRRSGPNHGSCRRVPLSTWEDLEGEGLDLTILLIPLQVESKQSKPNNKRAGREEQFLGKVCLADGRTAYLSWCSMGSGPSLGSEPHNIVWFTSEAEDDHAGRQSNKARQAKRPRVEAGRNKSCYSRRRVTTHFYKC